MKILMAEHTHYDSLFRVGCHHLAEGFARKGHQVTYLSTPVTPVHSLHFLTSKRTETLKRFVNWSRGGQAQSKNLFSYVPFSLLSFIRQAPMDNDWVAWNHLKFTFPSLETVVQSRGPFDVFLMGDPRFVPLMKEVKARVKILRLTDNVLGFEATPRSMAVLLKYAVENCDKVIVTARPLQKWLAEKFGFKKAVYVPNGVDLDHFQKIPAGEPEDLRTIPKPRAVYVGAIEKWFDLELLSLAASQYPKISFVLIGPPRIDLSGLNRFKNVHVLGSRPYESIPRYLAGCQVGIIPFKNNDLINSVSPIKLYEYMACGLPVVSVEWEELKGLKSPAYLSKDSPSFLRGIGKALEAKPRKSSYTGFARRNSWGDRVEQILKIISRKNK